MANLSLFPASDIQQMADLTGFSVFEIEEFHTDELLKSNMELFYTGRLDAPLVDPTQKISAEDASFFSNFARLTVEDAQAIADSALSAGKAILPTLSLGLIAVIGITAVLILRTGG